eukprot:scaffold5011_cov118-Skeletonema_marinoi.AAC.1
MRTRQQTAAAVRRSPRRTPSQSGPPSILRSGQQRNNIRRVMFTATCTAQPFHHTLAPESVLVAYDEEVTEIELPHVEERQAQEEEEGVQFEDAGHVPEESVEQRKRTAMGREVAGLASDLGVYWSAAAPRRLRRSRRSTRAPERFVTGQVGGSPRLSQPGQLEGGMGATSTGGSLPDPQDPSPTSS